MNARSNKMLGFIETTILQEGLVRITNRRMLVGTMTYWMSDIRSVTVTRQERSNQPLWLVIVGLFFLLWSGLDQTGYYGGFFNIGTLLVIAGLALILFAKPTFALQIKGASGETSILRSTNRDYIQRIAGAMNKAIAGRAQTI
jgi:hypothetical protein